MSEVTELIRGHVQGDANHDDQGRSQKRRLGLGHGLVISVSLSLVLWGVFLMVDGPG